MATIRFSSASLASSIDFTDPLVVKGLDHPDEVVFQFMRTERKLNGDYDQIVGGFKRRISVVLNVVQVKAVRVWIEAFSRARDKQLIYAGETVNVAMDDPTGFQSQWIANMRAGRAFTLVFIEKTVWHSLPPSWQFVTVPLVDIDGVPLVNKDGVPLYRKVTQ